MRIRRCFTLLEITLAVALLVLIASVIGVNVKKLVDTHRFESHVSDFFVGLQQAQVLSAAYQTDFALDIRQEKKRMIYRFSTDEPFLDKQFSQEWKELPTGIELRWTGQVFSQLHLDVYAGGQVEPRGILEFAQTKEENARMLYIDLQYGCLMKFCYAKPMIVKSLTNLQKPVRI